MKSVPRTFFQNGTTGWAITFLRCNFLIDKKSYFKTVISFAN